jgi:quercetin dioxygenase-like cupin family protein
MSAADKVEQSQRAEIRRLSTEIKERYDEPSALEVGFLDPKDMELGQGWTQYHLFGTDAFDAWMRKGDVGAYLPEHVYPDNNLYMLLLEGEVRITLDGEPTVLDEGHATCHAKPGTVLEMEALAKSETITIFRPPIAEQL